MRRVLLSLSLLGLVGCSTSDIAGSGDVADQPSAAQANAFAEQFASAFSNGLANASASMAPRFSAAPSASAGGAALVPINQQFTGRTNCTSGGRIEVSGSLTGNIDQNGSGILLLQVLETITDWRCIPPFVINGDPYLSASGSIPFLNGQISSAATINFGGGFKWGTGAADSFQINMTLIINPDGSGRISGVAGPYSINVTF